VPTEKGLNVDSNVDNLDYYDVSVSNDVLGGNDEQGTSDLGNKHVEQLGDEIRMSMYVYSSLFFLVINLNRRFLCTRGNCWDNRNCHERLQRLVEGFSKQMEDMVCAFQQWCFRMKDAGLSNGISPPNDEAVKGTVRIILFDTHRE
jgi:hypothetical protein